MREFKRLPAASLRPDPDQPRKHFDTAALDALAASMKQQGQIVPLIVYDNLILDGEMRWRAAHAAGLQFLEVLVLEARPTPTELRILQLSIDVHRSNLSAIERSDLIAGMMRENGWSVSQLAEKTHYRQPSVTRLLKYQDACPELRKALHAGTIDQDKAYTICQESDHARQRELLQEAGGLSREQLRRKARGADQGIEPKASVIRLPLPSGILVTVRGGKLTLADVLDTMRLTVRQLKKDHADGLDVTTVSKVFADRASAGK